MSNNYPYRRAPPAAADSWPDHGTYRSSDRRHASEDYDIYRLPHEASSHLSSSSSGDLRESSYSASRSDNALILLSSCGLEPDDLARLAELPEDVLTVESLPHLLQEIKDKRGVSKPYLPIPSSSSSSSSSSARPSASSRLHTAGSSSSELDSLRGQPVQYPLDHAFITPKPLPPEQVQDWQDRWGNPRRTSSSTYKPSSSVDPKPLPPEQVEEWQDRWGNPRRNPSTAYKPSSSAELPSSASSSSSSSYAVDYDHRVKSTDYDKSGRDGGSGSRYDRPSYSSAEEESRSRNSASRLSHPGSADYRFAPPPDEYRAKAQTERRNPDHSSIRSSSSSSSRLSKIPLPSKKAALDFHGSVPETYPYSCTLCGTTVLTEKFWLQHINGSQHADGQLNLLQWFPDWDCRMETIERADSELEKPKDEGRHASQSQTASQSSYPQPNKKSTKKSAGNSKVVCVKFPAHSVDEKHLRTLTEPFGKIVKVIMFPTLAFVELGSTDQAKDLVKYYENHPPSVKGENMSFYMSNTFNFLQSSRVLTFTPAPAGEDGFSDLISIAKRFGPPLYTLFLPSMAFVEMKKAEDAQKLNEYYSSNTLRINSQTIKVAFSGEYNTLMRVSSAKRYEEESSSTKRTKSPSSSRDEATPAKKRRGSRDGEDKERSETRSRSRDGSRSRSRSRDRSSRAGRSREKTAVLDKTQQIKTEPKANKPASSRSRSRSRDKSRSRSRDKSRSRSRDKSRSRSRDKSKSKSRSRDKSRDRSSRAGRSMEKAVAPEKTQQTETEPKTQQSKAEPEAVKPASPSKPETSENEPMEAEAASSGEESDIEGMEVIGEDGENLEDDYLEILDEASGDMEDEEEEENKEGEGEEEEGGGSLVEEAAEGEGQAETIDSPEQGDEEEKPKMEEEEDEEEEEEVLENEATSQINFKKEESETSRELEPQESTEMQLEDDEDEPDFPEDLENCITLDELDEDKSDDEAEESRDEPKSCRVIYVKGLPQRYYTDSDFVKIVKGFGKVARYYLNRNHQQGFIEMCSSSEAFRAVRELSSKTLEFHGSQLVVQISHKYRRLVEGWEVQSDAESDEERRRESRSRSRRSERSSKSKSSETEESNRKSAARQEPSKKTPEIETTSKKTPEEEPAGKKTPEEEPAGKKTVEKELAAARTPEKELAAEKTNEEESTSKKTPEEEDSAQKTLEHEELEGKESPQRRQTRQSPQTKPASKKTPEKRPTKQSFQKQPASRKSPETEHSEEKVERKRSPEKESAAEKSPDEEERAENAPEKQEDSARMSPEEESVRNTTAEEETPAVEGVCSEETASKPGEGEPERQEETEETDPPGAQAEQRAGGDGLEEGEAAAEVEQQSEPAGGAAEPPKPTKPVGTEFVRPVVGYFCNLCQVIYADEDEAKQQHCSSRSHYQRYQEKTGKDPWAD